MSRSPAVSRREWFRAAARAVVLAAGALLAGRSLRDHARGVRPACPEGTPCSRCAQLPSCTRPEARTGGIPHGG